MNTRQMKRREFTSPLSVGTSVLLLAMTTACGSSTAPPEGTSGAETLAITAQPASTRAGATILPNGDGQQGIRVEIRDADGNLVKDADNLVTASIGTNAEGVVLNGLKGVRAFKGVATFNSLSINKAGVGYTLVVSASGVGSATTDAFDVSPGAPARLAFTAGSPKGGKPRAPIAMSVEVTDAFGNRITDATNPVTLDFLANPGSMLLHASGSVAGGDPIPLYERVDPETGVAIRLPFLPQAEVLSIVHAGKLGTTLAVTTNPGGGSRLISIDPSSGIETPVGATSTPIRTLVDLYPPGGLLSASGGVFDDHLYAVSPTTSLVTPAGTFAPGLGVLGVDHIVSMAAAPGSPPQVYGVVALAGSPTPQDRTLVTIGLDYYWGPAHNLNFVGPLPENDVVGLTTLPDGTLLAITGDGSSTTPSALFVVEPAWGHPVMGLIGALGSGGQGEAIGRVPALISGTLTVDAVAGVATFDDVEIDGPGEGFLLKASAAGLAEAHSQAFSLTSR